MKKIIFKATLVLMVGALLAVCGCGKRADADKPIPEVKAEAEKMDASQLRDTVTEYKEAITKKAEQVKEEALKLKDIPISEMTGDKVKRINAKIDELKAEIDALTQRYNIYLEELKKKGGDTSGLQI